MEITILSEDENPMLHRTDVTFRVSHVEATPDRLGVRDSLAARLNKSAEEVVIRKLDTKFGMRTTIGEAKVYEGPEFTRDVEQEYMLARNKIGDYEGDGDAAEPPGEEPEEAVEGAPDDEAPDDEPEEATDDEAVDEEPAKATDEAPDDEPEEAPEEAAEDEEPAPADEDDDTAAEAEAVEE